MVTAILTHVKNGLYYKWTPEEIDILRVNYKSSRESYKLIRDLIRHRFGIERTDKSIQGKAGQLGLTKMVAPNWSEEEKETLRNMAGEYSTQEIAKKLRRTLNAVQGEAYTLNIPVNYALRSEWFTKEDLNKLFGVSDETINRWIKHKYLKFSMFNEYVFKFTIKQIKDFICSYPLELQGRNIDLIQFIDILTSKPCV